MTLSIEAAGTRRSPRLDERQPVIIRPDSAATDAARPAPEASVIIPAYNEAGGIAATIAELVEVLEHSARRYEVILVDDGSVDGTSEVAVHPAVRVIRHRMNRGYGAALKTGVLAANAPVVAFYDGDGQFRGADLERIVDALQGADAALGNRTRDSYTPWSRRGGKKVLEWFANYLSRIKIPDLNCGLRAFRREILLDYLHLLPSGFSASSTTTLAMLKEGHDVIFVPVTTTKRVGTSTVRPIKDGVRTAMLVMRLTTLFDPFRVFGPTAVVLFLAGIAWGLQFLVQGRGLSVTALFLLISGLLVFLFGLLTDQVAALRRERRYSPRR